MSKYTVGDLQQQIILILKGKIENPSKESQRLLMYALSVDELWLMLHKDEIIIDYVEVMRLARRRAGYEPLEYITKSVSFYSENFFIDYGALIPRPETELLIDEVLSTIGNRDTTINIMEVGIGSGIISIILAKKLKNANIFAVDISENALKIAQKNIKLFGMEDRIELIQGSLLDDIPENIDYIVSNPPYIANDAKLEKNLDYEPQESLFGGVNGCEIILELLRSFFKQRIKYISCEIGYDQQETVRAFVAAYDDVDIKFYKDLSHLDRGFTLIQR